MMFYISLVVTGIVTQGHNKDEFIGVSKLLFFKSVAIMQTNLCSADFEMLFWTLWTWRNTAKAHTEQTREQVHYLRKL